MNEWLGILAGVVLTVGTGFFVAAEFALVNLDRHELEQRQQAGEQRLGSTITALRVTSTHLSSAQLGITLTTLLAGYTFEPAISGLIAPALSALGLPETWTAGIGTTVGVVIATIFSMVIGELVPKNFALALPLRTAQVVVPFQILFTTVFKPLVLLFNNTANAVIRRLGVEPKEELSGARSAEELSSLIVHSARKGLLDQGDAQLLRRSIAFADHDAAEVMTPRVRLTTVSVADTAAQIIRASLASGHSRFPVIDGTPDVVTGAVHVRDAFAVPREQQQRTLAAQLQHPVLRVPEGVGVQSLLAQLRAEPLQLAVVVDEHGGTDGIVTLEDLAEEMIGELEDEHDPRPTTMQRQGRAVTFDAGWRPDELRERTGIIVPDDGDSDTIGGFIVNALGRMPELGDETRVPGGMLRVDRADGGRIVRVQFRPDPPVAPEAEDEEA